MPGLRSEGGRNEEGAASKILYSRARQCHYFVKSIVEFIMMWTNRTDVETSTVIDRGVLLAQSNGEAVAWSYLARHGISESSIVRILSPRRRPPVTALLDTQPAGATARAPA